MANDNFYYPDPKFAFIQRLTLSSDEDFKTYVNECISCADHGCWPADGKIYKMLVSEFSASNWPAATEILINMGFESMRRYARLTNGEENNND